MAKVINFMSHRSVSWALDGTQDRVTTPTEALVLVALVEFADADGRSAFPSVARVARRARCSTRTVRRVLKKLVERGVLVDGGIGDTGTRVYHAPDTRRFHDPFGPVAVAAKEAS